MSASGGQSATSTQANSVAPSTSVAATSPASSAVQASSSTSTTPTSSANPTSSASSAVSSASSSSASDSSTKASSVASSSTTSTPTSASAKSSSSSSLSYIIQTSNGQVYTQTAIVTVPNSSPTATQASGSSGGFLHNTGAVAAVFSIAGVICLIVVFFLFTSFVRRRRARKFDREIDEAAAAAAASATAPDFDDLDYTSGRGYGYSETSHGTFNQPPLSHEQTHNNLGDMPAPFEQYNAAPSAGAGAAGIGARGRSQHGGRQPDPYGALANPPEQYEMYETRRSWHQGNPHGGAAAAPYDILHAAGMAGSDPYAVTRKPSTALSHTQSQSGISGVTRTSTLPTTAESYPMPIPPGYPGAPDTPYPPEKARYSGSYVPAGGASTMPPDEEDAYGGYHGQPSAALENPHSPAIAEPPTREDGLDEVVGRYEDAPFPREPEEPARASIADDEDYGFNSGRRVLRVANE